MKSSVFQKTRLGSAFLLLWNPIKNIFYAYQQSKSLISVVWDLYHFRKKASGLEKGFCGVVTGDYLLSLDTKVVVM